MIINGNDTEKTISLETVATIMERFNFQRVHDAMVMDNHTWYNGGEDGRPGVPSVEALRLTARRLLTDVVKDFNPARPYGNRGTGGLCVYSFPWGLELVYKFESYSNY
jgi:hypothetical protein